MLVLALALAAEQLFEDFAAVALDRPADAAEAMGLEAGLIPERRALTTITPGGAADRAGLRAGDAIELDLFGGFNFQPNSRIPVTVNRDGGKFAVTLVAQAPAARSVEAAGLILSFAVIRVVLFGLIVLLFVRARGKRTANLLAVGLMVLFTDRQSTWLPHWTLVPIELLWAPVTAIGVYCLTRFPLEISSDRIDPKQARLVLWLGTTAAVAEGIFKLMNSAIVPVPFGAMPGLLLLTGTLLSNLTGIALMIANYPKADARTRNRIKVVASAFLCIGLGWLILRFVLIGMGVDPLTASLLSAPFSFLGLGLLTYAVLGQRLFDFGFAINRTLVYGAVSFTLLAAFGLAEWGADRLVPESWHRQSALYSAGIALLLFLSFHRVRDWFERQVERLFFAGWQRAQADLKRFVASAGHFRQAPALYREFAAEVERFAQGAPAALYLREEGGGFMRQCGALAAETSYSEEDRAFALLDAERTPVDLAEAHSALPGAMAFPMFDQLGLAGFVLIGARPDGAHYRPDEIENLAWATHQVGLDLQALQARELRAEVVTLREQLAARRRRPPKLAAISSNATA
jgi:hypothetical protein